MPTSGGTGWYNGTVEARLSDNINLNGWISARIVHRTSVDLRDSHDDRVLVRSRVNPSLP